MSELIPGGEYDEPMPHPDLVERARRSLSLVGEHIRTLEAEVERLQGALRHIGEWLADGREALPRDTADVLAEIERLAPPEKPEEQGYPDEKARHLEQMEES